MLGQQQEHNDVSAEDLKKIEYLNKVDRLDKANKQKYRLLLCQLSEMGYTDFDKNLKVAKVVGVDINAMIARLD
jgi:hypothetical protein